MKIFTLILTFLLFLWSETLSAQSPDLISTEIAGRKALLNTALSSPAGSNFKVNHYRCEWAINPAVRYISGRVRCDFRVSADTASLLFFDFSSQLSVDSVLHRGVKISSGFSSANLFWIKTPVPMNLGTRDSVSIYYRGVPANSGFGSFNKQAHAGQPIIWTMSCPYASSDWWPCVQSHRQKADSIDMIIRVPASCRAAGNGKLMAEIQTDSTRTFYWKHKHPIASYLVATAVTNYASFSTKMHLPSMAANDSMPVLNFVYPEALSSASFNLPKVMPILAYYDSLVAPYPFRDEKYGHAQFGWGGGMEHQTMSFMTNFSVSLQAHELAHQWFGNHITCRSWTDVWLNEGWATYMAALAEQKMGTASFQTWLNSTQGAVKASPGGSVWVDDTSDINRIFDSRLTYKKGALLLHMLRWELGDSAFWAGVRNYQSDPALIYGFATTEQFFQHMEQASGRNLSRFQQDWFYGQGYPNCQLRLSSEGSGIYRLRIGQTSSHASVPFFQLKIPVRIAGSGQDTTMVFSPDSSGQEFLISLPFVPSSMVFDPTKWLLAKSSVQIVTSIQTEVQARSLPKIAPNPFGDSLEISFEKFPATVRIFNLQGKEVLRQLLPSGGSGRVDTRNLIPGSYLLLWESSNQSTAMRLLKE